MLDDANLAGANHLDGAILEAASLVGANLRGARLAHLDVTGSGMDLTRAGRSTFAGSRSGGDTASTNGRARIPLAY